MGHAQPEDKPPLPAGWNWNSGFPKLFGGPIRCPPAVALGNVYVGSDDGLLHAFNARAGNRQSHR
jgi:outer membrane protein assembly factor BamB